MFQFHFLSTEKLLDLHSITLFLQRKHFTFRHTSRSLLKFMVCSSTINHIFNRSMHNFSIGQDFAFCNQNKKTISIFLVWIPLVSETDD